MSLPAFVPGTIGLLHVQAIGMYPAPYLMLAAGRAEDYHQGAQVSIRWCFKAAHSANGAPVASPSTTEGIETDDEIGSLLDRRTHALHCA